MCVYAYVFIYQYQVQIYQMYMVNFSAWKTTYCLSCICNIMAAKVLEFQGPCISSYCDDLIGMEYSGFSTTRDD